MTDYVLVHQAVAAAFSATPTGGPAPLPVTFNNLATGAYDTCLWDFGDGASSNLCAPGHTYSTPGAYDVALSVSGLGGSDTLTRTAYIAVAAPGAANFSADPTSGVAPLTVLFSNLSNGAYDTCLWTLGDGGASSECAGPSHTYQDPGVYTVTLDIDGAGGPDQVTRSSYITVYEASVADFSATPTSGQAPLTVLFTDLSSGDYSRCTWDWGDGGTGDQCNVAHTYATPGVYTVSLTVDGPGGQDGRQRLNYITVTAPPPPRYDIYAPRVFR